MESNFHQHQLKRRVSRSIAYFSFVNSLYCLAFIGVLKDSYIVTPHTFQLTSLTFGIATGFFYWILNAHTTLILMETSLTHRVSPPTFTPLATPLFCLIQKTNDRGLFCSLRHYFVRTSIDRFSCNKPHIYLGGGGQWGQRGQRGQRCQLDALI